MKTQMRFQKIFMLVSLIIAALCVVFALIFVSGSLFEISRLYNASAKYEEFYTVVEGTEIDIILGTSKTYTITAIGVEPIFQAVNKVSDVLLVLGIIMVLCVVFNYITATGKRRNYYITNYISIGIVVAFAVALAIVIIVMGANVQSLVANADYDKYLIEGTENYRGIADVYNHLYPNKEFVTTNVWTVYVGYVLAVLLILDAVGFVLNLVWKIKLMQGEKALLQGGLVKEVA